MALLSQLTSLLVISVNVLTWGQSSTPAESNASNRQSRQSSTVAQTPTKAPATYVLEPIETSNAIYPPAAREQKIEGQVVATILVSETGAVESARVLKGDKLLAEAVQETPKKWKFKPVIKEGNPVAVVSKVTLNFVLGDDNQSVKGVVPEISPATEFPQRVRVSSGVSAGLLLKKVSPAYPKAARDAHIQGQVLLHAEIGKDGSISDVQLISGDPYLAHQRSRRPANGDTSLICYWGGRWL